MVSNGAYWLVVGNDKPSWLIMVSHRTLLKMWQTKWQWNVIMNNMDDLWHSNSSYGITIRIVVILANQLVVAHLH